MAGLRPINPNALVRTYKNLAHTPNANKPLYARWLSKPLQTRNLPYQMGTKLSYLKTFLGILTKATLHTLACNTHRYCPQSIISLYCPSFNPFVLSMLIVLFRFQFYFSQSQSNSGQVLCR